MNLGLVLLCEQEYTTCHCVYCVHFCLITGTLTAAVEEDNAELLCARELGRTPNV